MMSCHRHVKPKVFKLALADDLGCFGSKIATPNVNVLAWYSTISIPPAPFHPPPVNLLILLGNILNKTRNYYRNGMVGWSRVILLEKRDQNLTSNMEQEQGILNK